MRRPEGQGLNDLYVRFFRMAERRIAEKTGQGVVCFISNYSWLDGLSFTGMRERFLEAFDTVRIDCLNGDKYKTGKVAPDGSTGSSIFRPRRVSGRHPGRHRHRDPGAQGRIIDGPPMGWASGISWGRRLSARTLLETAETVRPTLYEGIEPVLPLGLPFVRTAVSETGSTGRRCPTCFPASFPGVKTSGTGFSSILTWTGSGTDRVVDYFDASLSHDDDSRDDIRSHEKSHRISMLARSVRDRMLDRGGPREAGLCFRLPTVR